MASTRRSIARSETESVRPTSLAINKTQRFSLIAYAAYLVNVTSTERTPIHPAASPRTRFTSLPSLDGTCRRRSRRNDVLEDEFTRAQRAALVWFGAARYRKVS